jgi:hypothetical protein
LGKKFSKIKVMKIGPVPRGRANRRTDMTKIIVTFRRFTSAPKNVVKNTLGKAEVENGEGILKTN